MFIIVFNIACFVSLIRFVTIAMRGPYHSWDLILAVVGLVAFPIGVGLLNRGSFLTMVIAFGFAIGSCGIVAFVLRA